MESFNPKNPKYKEVANTAAEIINKRRIERDNIDRANQKFFGLDKTADGFLREVLHINPNPPVKLKTGMGVLEASAKKEDQERNNKTNLATPESKERTKFAEGLYVSWEVEDKCNLGCEHCYSLSHEEDLFDPSENTKLSLEQIKQGIDNLAEVGVTSFNIEGGEPTLRKDIVEITTMAKEKGMNTIMSTHGMLLLRKGKDGEVLAEKLRGVLDVLSVSLDAPVAEVDNQIRQLASGRPSDHFEKVTQFLEWYGKEWLEKSATGKPLYELKINVVVTEKNVDLISEIGELLKKYLPEGTGTQLKIIQVHPRGLAKENESLMITNEQFNNAAKEVKEKYGDYLNVTVRPYTAETYPFIVISSKGDAIIPEGRNQHVIKIEGQEVKKVNVLKSDFYDLLKSYTDKNPTFLEQNKKINTYIASETH